MAISKIIGASVADDAIDVSDLGTIMSVGETAPSSPFVGQRWYKASTAITYQYTNDGSSSFWLDISSGGIGTSSARGVDYVGDTDPLPNHNGGSATLSVGQVYYNREKNKHFVCTTATDDANVWSGRFAGAGGTVVTVLIGSTYYRVHTFLKNSTFYVEDSMNVDYLVVGGGGGGANGGSNTGQGGGGAGGFRTAAGLAVAEQTTYSITVGAGGIAGTQGVQNDEGKDGGSSIFSSITSKGGGGGNGQEQQATTGLGSGGGGEGWTNSGAGNTGTAGQGTSGGTGTQTNGYGGGGGGGAGAGGGNGSGTNAGVGGVGENNIMGLNDADSDALLTAASVGHDVGGLRYFAGGGGGGIGGSANSIAAGGSGGGGSGSKAGGGVVDATHGLPNTGGGGGGGGGSTNSQNGGAGGSGIVIVRYALN